MSKIIINSENISDAESLVYTLKVINEGKISKNNSQYCFITTFESGIKVYANKTKTGTYTFRIWK